MVKDGEKMKRGVKGRVSRQVSRMMQRMLDAAMTLSRRQIVIVACAMVFVLSVFIAMPARAVVAFRSASAGENGAGATSVTITTPSGATAGDVLIASIDFRATTTNYQANPNTGGWTQLQHTYATGLIKETYYTVLASTPPSSYTFTMVDVGDLPFAAKASVGMIAYSGVDTISPIIASTQQSNAASTTATAPSVTTSVNDAMVIALYGAPLATTATPGGSMTERYDIQSSGGGSGTTKVTSAGQDAIQAVAGASGTLGMTWGTSAASIGHTVALRPASPSTLTQSAYRWFTNVDAANFSNVTTNPTTGTDAIYAATNDSSYLYTAGYYSSNGNDWRIEKRDLSDGTLVSGFGTSGVVTVNVSANDDRAWGIDQDSSYIYVVGQDATVSSTNTQWRIEKRDKTTGALVSGFGTGGVVQLNQTSGLDIPKEVKVDGSYVYVAGFDNTGMGAWRIEKRDITTGALVSGFGTGGAIVTDYEATENDEIAAMVIDANNIYVGGFDYASGVTNSQSRTEKRDKTTGALVSGFGTGGVVLENPFTGNSGSTIDDGVVHKGLVLSGGSLYTAASQGVTSSTDFQWRITKRDATTGALVSGFGSGGVVNVNPGTAIDNPTSIRTDGTSLFVAGFDRTLDASMSQWRIEKRDMTSGALVSGFGTSGTVTNNPSTNHDEIRDMVVSGTNIYPVGYDVSPGNYQMRIEKRNTVNGNGPSDLGVARSALNTPATSVAAGEEVRLRLLLRVGTSLLGISDQSFRLQFAERSGTCDAGFSGETYANMTGTSTIALNDNINLSDSSPLYLNVNDPTDGANPVILQAYDEFDLFSNSAAAIPVNSNGLWDISIVNYSAPLGKTYCFRVVDSTGTPLAGYGQIAELSTPPAPTYSQANYRLYANSDSSSPGAALAAQDTPGTVTAQTPFRLRQRVAVDSGTLPQSQQSFNVQYAEKSGVCDVSFSGETYQNVTSPIATAYASPTSGVSDASSGDVAWTSPGSALSSNNTYASATLNGQTTQYLKTTGFGFSVPAGATITGVEARIEASADINDYAYISSVKIVKSGTVVGTDLGVTSGGSLFTSDTVSSAGGDTQLGGQTLTPSDVNASTFGVAVTILSDLGLSTVYVDHIELRVNYQVDSPFSYAANPSAANGVTITSSGNDPTNGVRPTVLQAYRETGPFENSAASIPNGSDGLWDFVFTTNATADGKSYCLRVVKSNGSVLDTYSQIAEVTIGSGGGPVPPTLNQQLRGGQSVIDGVKRFFSW